MRVFVYRGMRCDDGCAVIVETYDKGAGLSFMYVGSEPLPARNDIRDHSPDGFNWGYGGSGPAQLALALIAHATGGDHVPPVLYQSFKFAVVGRLSQNEWALCSTDILRWLYQRTTYDLASDRPPTDAEIIDLDKGPAEGYVGDDA